MTATPTYRFFTAARAAGETGTKVGFCGHCGYVRQDTNGVADTDCLCMAEMEHKLGCDHLAAISSKVGIACEAHGEDVCPECDACTCAHIEGDVVNPTGEKRVGIQNVGTTYMKAAELQRASRAS